MAEEQRATTEGTETTEEKSNETRALEILQHYVMQPEGSWESFQQRMAALRFAAARFQQATELEERVRELEGEGSDDSDESSE